MPRTILRTMQRLFTRANRSVGSYFYPPYCIFCGEMGRGPVCDACAMSFGVVSAPFCQRCGKPLISEYEREECPHCSSRRGPNWRVDAARSLFVYSGTARQSLHRFKYNRRRVLARYFAEELLRHFGELSGLAEHFGWERGDIPVCLVPMPLHPMKRFRRGFNQNELVLQFYAPAMELPVRGDLLRRVKNTPSQVGLSQRQRQENVKGAFAVPQRRSELVRGRSVLLFDDLITTGATINAAARALKSAGAKRVYALSLFTASLRG